MASSSYRVPEGLPGRLAEARRLHRALGELLQDASVHSGRLELEAIADKAHELWQVTRESTRTESLTGCDIHPNGAIEPLDETPPGWGRCLLCNTYRRRRQSVPRRRSLPENTFPREDELPPEMRPDYVEE